MGYEFNQQVVAESFQALYVERGRPLLARADLDMALLGAPNPSLGAAPAAAAEPAAAGH